MKRLFVCTSIAVLFLHRAAFADDLDALAGKWSMKRVNDQGQNLTQTIEIKKDKLIFEILSSDQSVVLHAEGDVKLEKLGPFSTLRLSHIRAGSSSSNLDDVDDVYVSVYTLDEEVWTMATNFDKQREGQKPRLDVYRHVKTATASKESR
jgi:hypothetical protein